MNNEIVQNNLNKTVFLFKKKVNENWSRDNQIIYLYFNFNSKFDYLANQFDLTRERIRQIISNFISSLDESEKSDFFLKFYINHKKFSNFSKFFKKEFENYKLKIEKLVEKHSHIIKYNDNEFKIIDKKDILKTNINFFLKPSNYFKLKIPDFKNKLILINSKSEFSFNNKILRKYKVDIIAKAHFELYTKYKINDILIIYKIYFPKMSKRAIEGMLFNYNELFSLSGGKYMISYYKNENEYLRFSSIANSIYEKIDLFFTDEKNIICDVTKFYKNYNFQYPFLNEHHYYFFAKKYSNSFNKKFDSFRSPIIFLKIKKEQINGKDVNLLFKKQIDSFLKENEFYNKWINKRDFLKEIYIQFGIKDYYFLQKAHLFKFDKAQGNRNESGKIKFLIDN